MVISIFIQFLHLDLILFEFSSFFLSILTKANVEVGSASAIAPTIVNMCFNSQSLTLDSFRRDYFLTSPHIIICWSLIPFKNLFDLPFTIFFLFLPSPRLNIRSLKSLNIGIKLWLLAEAVPSACYWVLFTCNRKLLRFIPLNMSIIIWRQLLISFL
jgi:hypothetical protein